MTQRELKEKLYDLVSSYFGGAEVVWGQAKKVRPQSPLIALRMGDLQRHPFPITKSANGVPIDAYCSKTTLQVDLYTKGAKLRDESGVTAATENTAADDMADFLGFIGSAYVSDWCVAYDVSIFASGPIRDLTQLINDSSWDYRAMVELDVAFTQFATGYTGTMHEDGTAYGQDGLPLPPGFWVIPTPSGGRTQELAGLSTGWYEQVETEMEELNDGQP